jgi:NitT/TauT family transport system substrate-binding protein
MTTILRLNQGDASEARIYYCAHFVALALGLFEKHGVTVEFTTTNSGGHTVRGGQIPAVLSGEADLTIGGPMVTMKNHEEGGPALVSFCASVRSNPWFLASAHKLPDGFSLAHLAEARVIDIGNVGTATLTFRWLLEQVGLANVTLIPGSGVEAGDIAMVKKGEADFALHSLHALSPYVASGELPWTYSLAGPTGGVPWSAYIARPERIAEKREAFAGFVRAIEEALSVISTAPVGELAGLVAAYYPDMDGETLVCALDGYRKAGVFAGGSVIERRDFEHFATLLKAIGWLGSVVPYDDLVDTSLCTDGAAAK